MRSIRKTPLKDIEFPPPKAVVHIDAVFVHCRACAEAEDKDRIAVVILDGEVLTVVCENHKPPTRVCSVTIPLEERPL